MKEEAVLVVFKNTIGIVSREEEESCEQIASLRTRTNGTLVMRKNADFKVCTFPSLYSREERIVFKDYGYNRKNPKQTYS